MISSNSKENSLLVWKLSEECQKNKYPQFFLLQDNSIVTFNMCKFCATLLAFYLVTASHSFVKDGIKNSTSQHAEREADAD